LMICYKVVTSEVGSIAVLGVVMFANCLYGVATFQRT
jgi:hypothetical protein